MVVSGTHTATDTAFSFSYITVVTCFLPDLLQQRQPLVSLATRNSTMAVMTVSLADSFRPVFWQCTAPLWASTAKLECSANAPRCHYWLTRPFTHIYDLLTRRTDRRSDRRRTQTSAISYTTSVWTLTQRIAKSTCSDHQGAPLRRTLAGHDDIKIIWQRTEV